MEGKTGSEVETAVTTNMAARCLVKKGTPAEMFTYFAIFLHKNVTYAQWKIRWGRLGPPLRDKKCNKWLPY